MNHRPVCVKCEREMYPEKNGVGLVDFAKLGDEAHQQLPYQIWDADLWKCETCGVQVVVGFGAAPVAHHDCHQDARWNRIVKGYEEHSRIINCMEV